MLEVKFENSDALLLGPPGGGEQRNVNYQSYAPFRTLSEETDGLLNNITGASDDWNFTLVLITKFKL